MKLYRDQIEQKKITQNVYQILRNLKDLNEKKNQQKKNEKKIF